MLEKANIVYAVLASLVIVIPLFGWFAVGAHRGVQSYKVLLTIAEQFKTNGGSSLKDRLDQLFDAVDMLSVTNRTSMNLVPYPLFITNQHGGVVWVNHEFSQVTSLADDEVLGMGWLNIVDRDERDDIRNEWLSAVKDGRAVRLTFMMDSGSEALLEAQPLLSRKDKEIKVRGLLGTLRIDRGYLHG